MENRSDPPRVDSGVSSPSWSSQRTRGHSSPKYEMSRFRDVEVDSGWPPAVFAKHRERMRDTSYGAIRTCVSHARTAANDGNISVCLKDRCEQVYERRQQTSKGPDKRRNRESTWLTAITALDTPEAFSAAAYGLGLRVPAKSQLFSARYGERRACPRL